jgi:hypothetical protein
VLLHQLRLAKLHAGYRAGPKPKTLEEAHAKIQRLREKLNLLKDGYEFHRADADRQGEAFKLEKENLGNHQALLVADFKSNMVIGTGPVQLNRDYFISDIPISVFGVCLYFYPKDSDELVKLVFTFISDCLSHDTTFVVDCFEKIFSTKVVKEVGIQRVSLWSDNGPGIYTIDPLKHGVLSLTM